MGPKSSYGFTLPDGNVEYGQQYFVDFRCIDCHTIIGKEELAQVLILDQIDPVMDFPLGGRTAKIATYGQLVTSIINPSHKVSDKYQVTPVIEDGQSIMRNYNSIMTVDELIDIVAFLQDQYELQPYTQSRYMAY